jgi:CHC2-type zinc finger protein
VSRNTTIVAAKEKVSTLDLAERLCVSGLAKAGKEWVGRCPLPDHEDRTPSFCVDPDKNVWWCHGCLRGGDAITLAQRAWDIDRADVAAAEILLTFGYKIPPRPASWFKKQARQKSARDALGAAKILHLQRRVFRIFQPMIEEIEDEGERRDEARYLWDAAGEIAVCLWGGRRAA